MDRKEISRALAKCLAYLAWFRDYLSHGLRALALVDPPSAAVLPLMGGADLFNLARRTLAAERVRGPDHHWKPNFFSGFLRV